MRRSHRIGVTAGVSAALMVGAVAAIAALEGPETGGSSVATPAADPSSSALDGLAESAADFRQESDALEAQLVAAQKDRVSGTDEDGERGVHVEWTDRADGANAGSNADRSRSSAPGSHTTTGASGAGEKEVGATHTTTGASGASGATTSHDRDDDKDDDDKDDDDKDDDDKDDDDKDDD